MRSAGAYRGKTRQQELSFSPGHNGSNRLMSQIPFTLARPTRTELEAVVGAGLSWLVVVWLTKTRIAACWLVNDSTPAPTTLAVVITRYCSAAGRTVSLVNCL